MNTEQDKIYDAIDSVVDMVFAERIFNSELEVNQEKKNELRFAIMVKFNQMGVKLVEIPDDVDWDEINRELRL